MKRTIASKIFEMLNEEDQMPTQNGGVFEHAKQHGNNPALVSKSNGMIMNDQGMEVMDNCHIVYENDKFNLYHLGKVVDSADGVEQAIEKAVSSGYHFEEGFIHRFEQIIRGVHDKEESNESYRRSMRMRGRKNIKEQVGEIERLDFYELDGWEQEVAKEIAEEGELYYKDAYYYRDEDGGLHLWI